MGREVRLENAAERLATFRLLDQKSTAKPARAARLYSNAALPHE